MMFQQVLLHIMITQHDQFSYKVTLFLRFLGIATLLRLLHMHTVCNHRLMCMVSSVPAHLHRIFIRTMVGVKSVLPEEVGHLDPLLDFMGGGQGLVVPVVEVGLGSNGNMWLPCPYKFITSGAECVGTSGVVQV